ncbi:MAG: NADH-quinone oxidoreductase subunit L [Parachlamydiaceae bacterium]
MELAITIGLLSPLVGSLILLIASNKIGRRLTGLVACGALFVSLVCFSALLFSHAKGEVWRVVLFQWIPVQGIATDVILHLDTLSLLMTLIITGVGFLIHIYSMGYMDHEEDFGRFFACMNFFVFAMLLLVLAGNLMLLFVGWEGVGLASYLLIGFWYQRPTAAQAAVKAFVVNRIGDLGLLLGVILTFYLFGTTDIETVNHQAPVLFSVGAPVMVVLTLLYFTGAIGKSAQLPLQVWLPDAMAGPTPVSALIHAATMVTAGVYLIVRMHPVFMLAPTTLYIVGAIGAFTSLYAAFCAVGQNDLKKVLAYSTVSQLGFMFLACGVGAFFAAMFHLTMHAFMKGLLFLAAGNVVHMLHDTTDMRKMGGLAKIFTKTNVCFIVGVISMAGIPPLAAFFSKDLILEETALAGFYTYYYIALVASFLTAFYLTRAYCLTFMGKFQDPSAVAHVKEAPTVMLVPVMLLAVLAAVGGFLGFSIGTQPVLERFLAQSNVVYGAKELSHGFHFSVEIFVSLAVAAAGLFSAAFIYTRASTTVSERIVRLMTVFKKAFYVDEIYEAVFVIPLRAVAQIIAGVFEPLLFDGSIRETASTTQAVAGLLQKMQSGQIRSYIAWMAIGAVFLILYLTI